MARDNYANLFLLLIFAGLPLGTVIYLHWRTLRKHLMIIIKVNIVSFLIWLLGGSLAYRQHIWLVTYNGIFNTDFAGILLGDILLSVISTTILSLVTILMFETYNHDLRFRDNFFKKE